MGPPQILINNAGIASATIGREGARDRDEDWTAILLVNIQGTVRCCEAFLHGMKERRQGKIINVGSMAGHAARRIGGAYATSKAAILRYTKGLAAEVAPFGINVNAVCPGAVWTPLQERGIAYRQSQDPELAARDPYEIFTANYARTIPPRTAADRRGSWRGGRLPGFERRRQHHRAVPARGRRRHPPRLTMGGSTSMEREVR